MTIFNDARSRVIDANPNSAFRLFGIALVAFLAAIALFASVARVDSGTRWGAHLVRTRDRRSVA